MNVFCETYGLHNKIYTFHLSVKTYSAGFVYSPLVLRVKHTPLGLCVKYTPLGLCVKYTP